MRNQLIAAGVVATLAIALVGGAALAAPRDGTEIDFTFVGVEPIDVPGYGFSMGGDIADDLNSYVTWIMISYDYRSGPYVGCTLGPVKPSLFDDDGNSARVEFSGIGECPGRSEEVQVKVEAEWFYGDTRKKVSTTRDGSWLCNEKRWVDPDAVVHVNVYENDTLTRINGDHGPVGSYEIVEQKCRTVGKPG